MRLTWLQRLSLWLYGWAMWALVPLLKRKLRRRGAQEPGYLLHPEQRWGLYPGVAPQTGAVWVHAVSLGETRAAAILIKALRQQSPGVRILLTHGTATGRTEGLGLLQAGDVQVWQPWDMPSAVNRFLDHFQPRMAVLLETEVWPQLIHTCAQRGLPVHLVNARMSERSLKKAMRQRTLALPAYGRLTSALAQTEADAQRLRQLGAPVTAVMGNLKYDIQIDASQPALGQQWRASAQRPVVMLASSREGEEAQWLAVLGQLSAEDQASVQWLVVPRHPQRFDAVAQLIEASGWSVQRRSDWPVGSTPEAQPKTVWLGDSLGEMQAYYHLASVAWLGGSFEPLGGQNLIEAAACGCPIVMGPHTFNFAEAAIQAEQHGAAIRVPSMAEAWAPTQRWVGQPETAQTAQGAARQWLAQGQGAARACAQSLLSTPHP
jgi:3-deoxy-D-manno-octulosonic-acid transferase